MQISSVVVEWLGKRYLATYALEFETEFWDNVITNQKGLTLTFLCLGFFAFLILCFFPSRRAIMLARVRVRVSRALGILTLIMWAKDEHNWAGWV